MVGHGDMETTIRLHYATLLRLFAEERLLAIARQIALEHGVVLAPPRQYFPA